MKRRIRTGLALASVVAITTAGAAAAGSGNNASVLQESFANSVTGNSLSIDQTDANGSIIAGAERTGADPDEANRIDSNQGANGNEIEFLTPNAPLITADTAGAATQSGSGNEATITTGGSGTFVGLRQTGDNNTAGITGTSGQVLLFQDGNGNDGTLSTSDGATLASLLQAGNDNTATVTVSGIDSEGVLAQIGSGNTTDLNVDTNGASVSFTVQGNNTSATLPANVVSSAGGGQITIIQRPLGGQ